MLVVGVDYNLLLVVWFKEEIYVGINIGIICVMGGSGLVVIVVGLVFVFIMMLFVVSELIVMV